MRNLFLTLFLTTLGACDPPPEDLVGILDDAAQAPSTDAGADPAPDAWEPVDAGPSCGLLGLPCCVGVPDLPANGCYDPYVCQVGGACG